MRLTREGGSGFQISDLIFQINRVRKGQEDRGEGGNGGGDFSLKHFDEGCLKSMKELVFMDTD